MKIQLGSFLPLVTGGPTFPRYPLALARGHADAPAQGKEGGDATFS